MAINHQVAIIPDLHLLPSHRDHSFDIELILPQSPNTPGLEHDNFAPLRRTKVIGHTIDKQVIPRADPELEYILTFAEGLAPQQARALLQALLAIIGGKPDRIGLPSDHERLPNVKDQDAERRIDRFQGTVALGHFVI